MNLQEIFDKVVTHLRKQGKKALNEEGSCVYKASDGRMCAAGVLIPSDMYQKEFEGNSFFGILEKDRQSAWAKELILFDFYIYDLQNIHDSYSEESWEEMLLEFANSNKLQFQKK